VKIEDVYRPTVVTCEPSADLREVAARMVIEDTGSVAIVTDFQLGGVISERDLVRALAQETDPGAAPVMDYATTHLVTAALGEDTYAVARRMLRAGVRRLPVVGAAGELVGMVSMRDLFALEALI
jgi:CBS domain-containing protein